MRLFGNFLAVAVLTVLMGTAMLITSLAAAPRHRAKRERQRPQREQVQQRRPDVQKQFRRMCVFLNLDESQQEQAQALFKARRDEMKAVRENVRGGELEREQARQAMQDGFKAHRASFESLLTADQLEKLAIWEEQGRPRQDKKQAGKAEFLKQLNLNDSQKEQLAGLRKQHSDNLRGIRDRVKTEDLEREQARELLKAEQDRFRQDLEGVLSAEQMEKMDAQRGKMAGQGRRGRAGPVGHLMNGMRKRLELSDSQKEQLHQLAAPFRQQIRETLGQAREQELGREQVHLLIKPHIDAFIGELAGILDDSQQAQLNEFLEKMEQHRRQRAAGESAVNGSESTTEGAGLATGAELPKGFSLAQNSPNPFNPSTTISYSVPEGSGSMPVRLTIFDMRGREVVRLVEATSGGGSYSVVWDGLDSNGSQVSSGVYICKLQAGEHEQNRKMVMLK